MLILAESIGPSRIVEILKLGAHSDDIEIGCGGTILKLIKSAREIEVLWSIASADMVWRLEAQRSAGEFVRNARRA